jgi:hypothetical protein
MTLINRVHSSKKVKILSKKFSNFPNMGLSPQFNLEITTPPQKGGVLEFLQFIGIAVIFFGHSLCEPHGKIPTFQLGRSP